MKPDIRQLLTISLLFFVSAPWRQAYAAEAPRPNILVILCDDLGYADVGFNGGKEVKTPALDSLAKAGTIFTSAYVAHPFCGPSRMALMAGRYPHEFGGAYNLPNPGKGMAEYRDQGIPTSEMTIATVLQGAGYFTGAIGKWHMGEAPQFHPNKRGFDDFYGFLGGGHMYFPARYGPIYERQSKNGKGPFNEYIVPLQHNGKQVKETEYMTDALSREAVRFVTEAKERKQPFFLYLSYNAPHAPLEATDADLAEFVHINDEKQRLHAAMVYAVDRGVAKLMETLKTTAAFDNTLIVFLSDNGGKPGEGASNAPLSGGKGSIEEGGYRVPMFFHWTGKVPTGNHFDHPVSSLDFYPTFSRLAGATIPADKKLDGVDIWDAFLAGESPRPGGMIYALRYWNGFSNVGVRQNQWKVSKRGPNSAWQLYNLDEDIGETKDLSNQYPERVKEMVGGAAKWSKSHVQPLWFDSKNAADHWTEKKMPTYDKTFSMPSKGRPPTKSDSEEADTD